MSYLVFIIFFLCTINSL